MSDFILHYEYCGVEFGCTHWHSKGLMKENHISILSKFTISFLLGVCYSVGLYSVHAISENLNVRSKRGLFMFLELDG